MRQYSWWTRAEYQERAAAAAAASGASNTRAFTLNRSFQPGMQSLAATTWTGDRQDCSHPTILSFIKGGQPWVTCDMTVRRRLAVATFARA